MLKEVLLVCLLGAASLAMEVMKPLYHHPVYNLPVYSSQPYAALQNPAVTTYGNGPADPGTYFWVDICHIPHRKIAALFTAFDTDSNGIISFPEVNDVSLCDVLAADDANCHFVHDVMGDEIEARSEYDGHDDYMKKIIVENVLSFFHLFDANNDNLLNLNEFYNYANGLYDVFMFSLRSTRANPGDETDHDVITQDEWDCKQNVDEDGLLYPQCNPSPSKGQVLIQDLVGSAGDPTLDLWEFVAVMANLVKKAKASPHFDAFCSGYVPNTVPANELD